MPTEGRNDRFFSRALFLVCYTRNAMIAFEIHPELEARLEKLAKRKKQTKDAYVRRIVLDYLEDMEDIASAKRVMARIKSGKEKLIPHEEILRDYGMAPGVHANRKEEPRLARPSRKEKDREVPGRKNRAA
jgi:predicted DNA-binding protein